MNTSQENSALNSGQNTQNSTSADIAPAKSNTCASVELLGQLQQDIDLTMAALSDTHNAEFGYALDRIQQTIDYFNRPDTDGCTQQVANIIGIQLEEIRVTAKIVKAVAKIDGGSQ